MATRTLSSPLEESSAEICGPRREQGDSSYSKTDAYILQQSNFTKVLYKSDAIYLLLQLVIADTGTEPH